MADSARQGVDDRATHGFKGGAAYDTHRMTYAPEVVESLLKAMNLTGLKGGRIIDLAAGTGKFTELLTKREEEYEITAVEPTQGMREVLAGKGWKVTVKDGTATDMAGIEDDYADGVIVAQAFHWFSTPEALAEIHRVLIPTGSLGLIWNYDDWNARLEWPPSTKWEGKLRALFYKLGQETGQILQNDWPKVFENQVKSTPFTIQTADPLFSLPLGNDEAHYEKWLTREGLWDRCKTVSHIASLPPDRLKALETQVWEILNDKDLDFVENDKGEIKGHGRTVWSWTTAVPSNTLRSGG